MRDVVDRARVEEFLKELGRSLRRPTTVYLVGGASAVLEGWRDSTVDVDLKIVPDAEAFAVIPRLKERLRLNIELASPDQFLPALPGWEDRSKFISRVGAVEFRHYDFHAQALAKIERGFARDLLDVRALLESGRVERAELLRLARAIEGDLIRFPAVDPKRFLADVARALDPDAPHLP